MPMHELSKIQAFAGYKDVKAPRYRTDNLDWLSGFFYNKGYLHSHGIGFSSRNHDLEIIQSCYEMFNCLPYIEKRAQTARISMLSKPIKLWWFDNSLHLPMENEAWLNGLIASGNRRGKSSYIWLDKEKSNALKWIPPQGIRQLNSRFEVRLEVNSEPL